MNHAFTDDNGTSTIKWMDFEQWKAQKSWYAYAEIKAFEHYAKFRKEVLGL